MDYELTREELQELRNAQDLLQSVWEANEYTLKTLKNDSGIRSTQILAIIAAEIISKRPKPEDPIRKALLRQYNLSSRIATHLTSNKPFDEIRDIWNEVMGETEKILGLNQK